jgi:UDP-N-acetylglucosamine 2-epimerase (non-hydrolysing)
MPRVCFVVGARPNFMKTAPVHRALGELSPAVERLLVHTGQHYDEGMSSIFLRELALPEPDVFLGVGSGTHAEQTGRALVAVEQVVAEQSPDLVVVAGDVNSTLAAALAAVKLHVPVAHIESGLRSFDEEMPEEHNRKLTDHLSAVLLAHSANAIENLRREGIEEARIHLVGNTMIDSLLEHAEAARALAPWERFGLEPGAYVLVTLHRPTLVDDEELLAETAAALAGLAGWLPVIFPVHPRTGLRLERSSLFETLARSGVHVCEPLGYLEFLGLEAEARAVVTDSGGVQEETSALGVSCFTLRRTTERPVTVELGTNTVLGLAPARLAEVPELVESAHDVRPIPLWDGRAGERAARVLAATVGQ